MVGLHQTQSPGGSSQVHPDCGLLVSVLPNVLTFRGAWSLLLVAVCKAVLLQASGAEQLPAAAHEGLLLLLGVSRQNLLGQPNALVGLLLLAERRHHTGELRRMGGALCHILDYFY